MKNFVLISKDAMCTDYLPVYGNTYWHTPNIDELAAKGTIFRRYYTAAPSTVMSFYSMATGKYAHESGLDVYEKTYRKYSGETFFSKLREMGYNCHIVWADNMMPLKEYLDYFGDDVEIHPIDVFRQGVGAHYIHAGFLQRSEEKAENAFSEICSLLSSILAGNDNTFLWIHFPHVLKGEVSYGSDMELFDRYIGFIRSLVSDNSIGITADHGNMNGHKGKLCYGFDVYEPNIRVPLITPRIGDNTEINIPTSSVDLFEILFNKIIPKRKYVYSDCAYRSQPHRKLAIIDGDYKYIYNKQTKTEELYDLSFDPGEEFSLIEDYIKDNDRGIKAPSRELYFYPAWDKLEIVRKFMRDEKKRIWENGNLYISMKCQVKNMLLPFYRKIHRKRIDRGE